MSDIETNDRPKWLLELENRKRKVGCFKLLLNTMFLAFILYLLHLFIFSPVWHTKPEQEHLV